MPTASRARAVRIGTSGVKPRAAEVKAVKLRYATDKIKEMAVIVEQMPFGE